MSTALSTHISKHAITRMSQRGITKEFLSAVLQHADVETPVGKGATALRVSRKRAHMLNIDDRLHCYSVVYSSDATVVTVLPVKQGRCGRRYRRS